MPDPRPPHWVDRMINERKPLRRNFFARLLELLREYFTEEEPRQ